MGWRMGWSMKGVCPGEKKGGGGINRGAREGWAGRSNGEIDESD